MTKRPTVFRNYSGGPMRPWNAVRFEAHEAWSNNGNGGGRAHVPGIRDRQGWETLTGGGRRR